MVFFQSFFFMREMAVRVIDEVIHDRSKLLISSTFLNHFIDFIDQAQQTFVLAVDCVNPDAELIIPADQRFQETAGTRPHQAGELGFETSRQPGHFHDRPMHPEQANH